MARVPGKTPIRFQAILDEKHVLPVLTGRFNLDGDRSAFAIVFHGVAEKVDKDLSDSP